MQLAHGGLLGDQLGDGLEDLRHVLVAVLGVGRGRLTDRGGRSSGRRGSGPAAGAADRGRSRGRPRRASSPARPDAGSCDPWAWARRRGHVAIRAEALAGRADERPGPRRRRRPGGPDPRRPSARLGRLLAALRAGALPLVRGRVDVEGPALALDRAGGGRARVGHRRGRAVVARPVGAVGPLGRPRAAPRVRRLGGNVPTATTRRSPPRRASRRAAPAAPRPRAPPRVLPARPELAGRAGSAVVAGVAGPIRTGTPVAAGGAAPLPAAAAGRSSSSGREGIRTMVPGALPAGHEGRNPGRKRRRAPAMRGPFKKPAATYSPRGSPPKYHRRERA